jgi:hypothetical protein
MVGQPVDKPNSRTLGRVIAASVALAPAGVLAGAVMILNPSAQLERGLASAAAIEARIIVSNSATVRPAAVAEANRPYEEGSEGFWLTRSPDDNISRVAWKAPVAAGDRIVVNFGPDNDHQILDVVSVQEDTPATTRIDTGVEKSGHLVITGRPLSAPDGDLVRLTVDGAGRGITKISGSRDRAL